MIRDSFRLFPHATCKAFTLFLLAFLFVLTPSCNKDKYWEPDEIPEKSEDFLSITVAPTGSAFRAGDEDPIVKLKDLTFLFFEGDKPDSKIIYVKELSASEATAEHQYTIRIKKGDYYLLVMANKTSYFSQKARIGTTLGAFNERTGIMEKSRFMDTDNLLVTMFNAQGLVPIKEAQFSSPEAGESSAAPIKVELEPTVSRFIISDYPTISADIKNLRPGKYYFSIVNAENTQTPLRELAPKSNGTLEALGDASPTQERYAFSPSYKPLEACSSEEEYKKVYREYRFYDTPNIPNSEKWYDKAETLEGKRKKALSYRFETTSSPKALLTAIVPHIFAIYRLCPASLSPAENEGWISYKGHYLLESNFKVLLQEANPKVPEGFPKDFLEAVKHIRKDAELSKLKKGFEAHGIRFYYNSLNYYAWPVRHFSNENAPNSDSYGRYGIVRNNEYRIKVKRLSTFGMPHPAAITEDFSSLKETSLGQVEISVVPMIVRDEQEVEY